MRLLPSLLGSYSRCFRYRNLVKLFPNRSLRLFATLENQFKYYNFTNSSDLSASALITQHKENMFAHLILESNPKFNVVSFDKIKNDLFNVRQVDDVESFLSNQNFNNASIKELLEVFKIVSVDSATKTSKPISSDEYSNLCSALMSRMTELTDDDIASVLLYLSIWPMTESSRSNNFSVLWKALDNACCLRMKKWTFDKVLYFIDLWYLIKLTRISDFVYRSINVMNKKIDQLNSQQVVQVLFYLNTIRSAHKGLTMYNIEHKLESYKDNLTLEELGVALLGFFKTHTSLKSEEFLKYIVNRTVKEMDNVKEITLASILKSLRLSMQIRFWRELPRFLDEITPHLHRFSLQGLAHVALLTAPSQTFHPPSLDFVSQKLVENISNCRLKDMEKVLFPLSRLNYDPKTEVNIYSKVVEELSLASRQVEIDTFPKSFIALVHCLALRSIFPQNLIAKVLDMDFIHKTYGRNRYHFGRELAFIDTCVELESTNYQGPRLPFDIRSYLYKRYSHYLPDENYKLSRHATLALDIVSTVNSLLGKQSAKFLYTVPCHPRPDIVLRAGGLPQEILSDPGHLYPVRSPVCGQTTVLVVVSKNMICPNDELRLNGETMSKIRSIKILGHNLKLAFYNEWPSNGSLHEKEECLEKILASETLV